MGIRPLIFCTGNANKLREVSQILAGSSVQIEQRVVDLPELQGEPEDIAREKCRIAAAAVNGPVLVEDTCLCFNALDGLPGPYVKWFLQKTGHEGLNNLLMAYDDKTAYALCTFALCRGPDDEPVVIDGRCDGTIVPARGPSTFGWDPVFQPQGGNLTFAEMPASAKNEISHRSKALANVKAYLKEHPEFLEST